MSSARNAVQTLIIAIAMSGYVHSDEGGAVDINDLVQHPIAAFEYVENDADAVIIYRAPLVTNSRREKEQHVTLNELEKRFSVALAPEGIRRDWGDAQGNRILSGGKAA